MTISGFQEVLFGERFFAPSRVCRRFFLCCGRIDPEIFHGIFLPQKTSKLEGIALSAAVLQICAPGDAVTHAGDAYGMSTVYGFVQNQSGSQQTETGGCEQCSFFIRFPSFLFYNNYNFFSEIGKYKGVPCYGCR